MLDLAASTAAAAAAVAATDMLVGAMAGELLWESAKATLESAACAGSHAANGPLIILDWDDTLMPTTALTDFLMPAACSSPVELLLSMLSASAQREELTACAAAAVRAVRAIRSVGRVVIVTNAIQGWVFSTALKCMPELASELVGVPVISARSIFEPQGISDPARWKALCFQRVARCLHLGSRQGSADAGQLISIGDSWHERAAVFEVLQEPDLACCVKSVKLLERPTIGQVTQQLELLAQCVDQVAAYPEALDACVTERMMLMPLTLPNLSATAAQSCSRLLP